LQTLEHTKDLHVCFYKFHLENMDQIVLDLLELKACLQSTISMPEK
jgi:hypothetical protein